MIFASHIEVFNQRIHPYSMDGFKVLYVVGWILTHGGEKITSHSTFDMVFIFPCGAIAWKTTNINGSLNLKGICGNLLFAKEGMWRKTTLEELAF